MREGVAPANDRFFNGWQKGGGVLAWSVLAIKTIRTSLRGIIQA